MKARLHDPARLLLIAGPCMLESEALCHEVAGTLAGLQQRHPELQVVFKGSFDKANRSSLASPRGPGLEKGLALLQGVGKAHHLPLLTDIHLPEQAVPAAAVVQVLQIPAFLCRQTDLLVAAARSGAVVNVKKGQFLSPQEVPYIVGKLDGSGCRETWLTERGTTFGYQNLVADMRSFAQLRPLGHPVIFDATHSVQLPGAGDGFTSGQRQFIPPLARAALAAGADGLFVETHPDPEQALSDGPNQVPLSELSALVESVLRIWKAVRTDAAPPRFTGAAGSTPEFPPDRPTD